MASKEKVLFLCTGNSCRSQMAEGFLRHYGGDRFKALSAGLDPRPVNPLAIKVMEEAGVDISGQRSKDLKEYLGKERQDYVVVVCDKAQKSCPRVWPGLTKERLFWPFEDPAEFQGTDEETLAKFREVRDAIDMRIKTWLSETAD